MNVESKVCGFLASVFFCLWFTVMTASIWVTKIEILWWEFQILCWYFYFIGYGFLLKFLGELHKD